MTDGAAPAFDEPYGARDVETDLRIGMVGCGNIGGAHLRAHERAGREVVALCDVDEEALEWAQSEFFPDAATYTDYRELLDRDDVDAVDLAVHPEIREAMIRDALDAGCHVYSEKPFAVDLDVAESFVETAERAGLTLAVNQSKRWNGVSASILNAGAQGVLGEPMAVAVAARRNKDPVPEIKAASHFWAFYNFGVHYFDFVVELFDADPERVTATATSSAVQSSPIPLIGQAQVDYPDAQASLRFDLNTPHGGSDRNYVIGSDGTAWSVRKGPEGAHVHLTDADGTRELAPPDTTDGWFGEFVAAIEADREPLHSGRNNLATLELVFAAVASADRGGEPVEVGSVRRLPENTIRSELFLDSVTSV